MFAFGPKKLTRQPAQKSRLRPEYVRMGAAGFVGPYLSGNFGGMITPSAQFTAIQFPSGGPDAVCQSSNSAADTGGTASLSVSSAMNKNNFTFIFVGRVRAFSGAGVGVRCNTDNIFLRSNGGNYSVRVNGVDTAGAAFPLGKWVQYVLTSNPTGISLWVNGVMILSAAASASSADVGVATALWEDSSGGGAMDADCAMTLILAKGLSRAEARALSINPWQVFDGPAAYPLIPEVTAGGDLDATVTTSQGQSADAVGSIGVDATGTMSQGQSADGLASVGVSAANTSAQGQSTAAVAGVGVDATNATSQGQTAAAVAAIGVDTTAAVSQGQTTNASSSGAVDTTVSSAQAQSASAIASIGVDASCATGQGQSASGVASTGVDVSGATLQSQTAASIVNIGSDASVASAQGQSSIANSEVGVDAVAAASQAQSAAGDIQADDGISFSVSTAQAQAAAGVLIATVGFANTAAGRAIFTRPREFAVFEAMLEISVMTAPREFSIETHDEELVVNDF